MVPNGLWFLMRGAGHSWHGFPPPQATRPSRRCASRRSSPNFRFASVGLADYSQVDMLGVRCSSSSLLISSLELSATNVYAP